MQNIPCPILYLTRSRSRWWYVLVKNVSFVIWNGLQVDWKLCGCICFTCTKLFRFLWGIYLLCDVLRLSTWHNAVLLTWIEFSKWDPWCLSVPCKALMTHVVSAMMSDTWLYMVHAKLWLCRCMLSLRYSREMLPNFSCLLLYVYVQACTCVCRIVCIVCMSVPVSMYPYVTINGCVFVPIYLYVIIYGCLYVCTDIFACSCI